MPDWFGILLILSGFLYGCFFTRGWYNTYRVVVTKERWREIMDGWRTSNQEGVKAAAIVASMREDK